MRVVTLTDFGSTFTKVTVVEDGSGRLVAQAQHPTTIATDVLDGYVAASTAALDSLDRQADVVAELAASSAGGGLRMAAVGIVAELTAAAGRQAALNAGARVELVAAGDLGDDDRARLAAVCPEVLLFCGGTDGGQRTKVLANAAALADVDGLQLVVVACNADVSAAAAAIFRRPDRTVHVVDNVLPAIDRLDIEPARRAVHELFVRHVIGGKGMSRDPAFQTMVRTPTPEAVLDAVHLLATWNGADEPDGVVVVDVGGATTDVHSVAPVTVRPAYITATGLPSIPVTRSVQGDLGMRWGAASVAAADGEWLATASGDDAATIESAAERRHEQVDWVPGDEQERRLDGAFAVACIHVAMRRHCGTLSTTYVPGQGTQIVQRGLDLRDAPLLIGTGGPLARRPDAERLLARAIARRSEGSLTPVAPRVAVDRCYLLAAGGLLSKHDQDAARGLLGHLREELDAHCAA